MHSSIHAMQQDRREMRVSRVILPLARGTRIYLHASVVHWST